MKTAILFIIIWNKIMIVNVNDDEDDVIVTIYPRLIKLGQNNFHWQNIPVIQANILY